MDKKTTMRLLVVVASVLLMGYFLFHSVTYYSKPLADREEYVKTHPQVLKKIVNLGLDLQGGMRLVLEVDRSSVMPEQEKDLLDRAYTVIENRINALGVAEPIIQKQGKDRIIVELPGLKDEAEAKAVIDRTAQLMFMLVREPAQLEHALRVIDNTLAGKIEADSGSALKDTNAVRDNEKQNLAEKIFKGQEDTAQSAETADTAGVEDLSKAASLKDFLAQIGDQIGVKRENIPRVKALLKRPDVKLALERAGLGGNVFLWSHDTIMAQGEIFHTLYYLKGSPEMRGDAIKDARSSMDQQGMSGGAKVDLEMNGRGARRFANVTAANVNRFLAIVLDSSVYSAPRIIQKIALGRAEITGRFSVKEARDLAVVLRAGALPAPMKIIEERTVGPSLGQDSIRMSVRAGLFGGILVILFILFYYRVSGIIAVLMVILNILGVLSIMAAMNATLTLPGIAGILLQIGMGVDANVLIYERIREELRIGKTARSAMTLGFDRAFVTIIDSNLTTIATALVLYWKGTGAIKGFALTLVIGLIVSLYLALFVTKVLLDVVFKNAKEKISI
ncbi:MAG: protein translocase subunit SecD [Chitinispirillaceae bacterium]|jgi:protein-export membrane protein SecD|nr:protein translocase subunit SecD [Chitinispirillaceae bacterium]